MNEKKDFSQFFYGLQWTPRGEQHKKSEKVPAAIFSLLFGGEEQKKKSVGSCWWYPAAFSSHLFIDGGLFSICVASHASAPTPLPTQQSIIQ